MASCSRCRKLAIVCGVSDADKLRQAFAEYRSIINDAIAGNAQRFYRVIELP